MEGGVEPRQPFVGRAEVVAALQSRFQEVRSGTSAVTLLVGDRGVGKSTLVQGLVSEMRGRGARVMVGRALASDAPPPFSLLSSAIESARDDPLLISDGQPSPGSGPVLIGFVPALDVPAYRDPRSFDARLIDLLGGGDPTGARSQEELLTALADRFLEYTRHGPAVLVLEDLDHADPPSLAAVKFFVEELQDRPLWVLATVRSADALSTLGRERVDRFAGDTHAERVVLRRLTLEEAGEYLRRTLPSKQISDEEVLRRFSETDGNPYILQQLDHSKDEAAAGLERALRPGPPLDAEAQEILDLVAVFGPTVPFGDLLQACEVDEERLAEAIDRLVGQGLLFERPGELLEFPEDRLREEVYSGLSERRRRTLHRKAGVALEEASPADPVRIYALARHFYLGHEPQKSVRFNRIAAEIAERSLAPETAWEHLLRAIESHREVRPENLDEEAELVLGLARVTEELGVLREAEQILQEFLARDSDERRLSPGHRAGLEVFLCRVLAAEGNLPATAELARRIVRAPGLDDQPLVRLGAHHHLGMVLYFEGRYEESLSHNTREVDLARGIGNPLILAHAQIWRVANLQMLGQVEQAIAEAREVTAARDRLGSVRESAMAHLVLGDILADVRSPPSDRNDAIQEYATAIRFAEQAKDPRRIGWALYKTSELLREQGRFEEAGEKVERARHILSEVGDQIGLAVSIRARGRLAMDEGRLDRAEADLLESLQLLQGTNNALEEIDVDLRLAQLAAKRGDSEGAGRYLGELRRLDLPRRRPDLRADLEALERSVAGTARGTTSSGP